VLLGRCGKLSGPSLRLSQGSPCRATLGARSQWHCIVAEPLDILSASGIPFCASFRNSHDGSWRAFLQKFHYTVMDWRPFRTIGKGMRLFTTTACTGFSSSSLSLSLPRQPKPSWIWPSLGWSTLNCRCGPTDNPCFQVFSGSILRTVVLPPSTAPASEHLWCPPHRSCHLPGGKAECMHASIACLLLHED